MSDPFMLYSSAVITRDDLSAFISKVQGPVGARAWTDEPVFVGTLQRGHAAIWVGLAPEELGYLDHEGGEKAIAKLGNTPRSAVVVERMSGDDSGKLALDFAILFAELWPAVCTGIGGDYLALLSHDELVRLRGAAEELPGLVQSHSR